MIGRKAHKNIYELKSNYSLLERNPERDTINSALLNLSIGTFIFSINAGDDSPPEKNHSLQ